MLGIACNLWVVLVWRVQEYAGFQKAMLNLLAEDFCEKQLSCSLPSSIHFTLAIGKIDVICKNQF